MDRIFKYGMSGCALLAALFAVTLATAEDKTPPMGGGMMGQGGTGQGGMMGGGMGLGGGMMGGGMGPGMMGGGMMGQGGMMGGGMMGMGPFGMLDLNDDQRSKINKIQDENRKKDWEIMGKIMDEQAKLRDLYAADEPDAKKIGAVYGSIAKLQQQMVESQVEAMNRSRAVLTKEQQEQLKQLRRGGMGMGMGPGAMNQGPMNRGSMNR